MYLRRQCYDKPHRCSGWAGGGWRNTYRLAAPWPGQQLRRCDGGSLWQRYLRHDPWMDWRFQRCYKCDIIALPLVTRWFDYTWWSFILGSNMKRRIGNLSVEVEVFHRVRDRRGLRRAIWAVFVIHPIWNPLTRVGNWWQKLYRWYAPRHQAEKLTEIAEIKAHYDIA